MDQRARGEANAWNIDVKVEVVSRVLGKEVMISPHCKQGRVPKPSPSNIW